MRRTLIGCLCAAAVWLLSAGVGLAATKKSCQQSWKSGTALFKAGKLRQAKGLMNQCAAAGCPAVMRKECATIATRLGLDIPTIVPSVVGGKDQQPYAVEVSMDGEVLAKQVDGRAIEVDPGLHEFVFKAEGAAPVKESLMIQQGQFNRRVPISFEEAAPPDPGPAIASAAPPPAAAAAAAVAAAAPAAPAPSETSAPTPPEASEEPVVVARRSAPSPGLRRWIPGLGTAALAGVGALGVAGYYLFAIWGYDDNRRLAAFCNPNCKPESVDHVRTYYTLSKISLGVGALALGGATYLYLRQTVWPSSKEVASTRSPRYVLQMVPTASGGWAVLNGSF